jgi:cysteine desulfurase
MGLVDPDDVEKALTEETVLVSIMHVNNEVGAIQPIAEIGKRLKKYSKVLFHVDAVQSFAKIPLKPSQANVDLMSISSHKLHGPKGIGGLYIRKNLSITPILFGGGQERGIRSGTENVPGIAGFAKAAQLMSQEREAFIERTYVWKNQLVQRIRKELPQMRVNGEMDLQKGAPYILNLSFPGLKSEVIVHALEKENVYVSSRSACSSKKEEPSRVLKAMGLSDEEALGAIRISMGFSNTKEDILHLENALLRVIPELQRVMKGQKK